MALDGIGPGVAVGIGVGDPTGVGLGVVSGVGVTIGVGEIAGVGETTGVGEPTGVAVAVAVAVGVAVAVAVGVAVAVAVGVAVAVAVGVGEGMGVMPGVGVGVADPAGTTVTQAENCDVSPVDKRVAVAVAVVPAATEAGNVTVKVACPAPSVVNGVDPRKVAPSPNPDGSHDGLEKNSMVNWEEGTESRVPCALKEEPVVEAH